MSFEQMVGDAWRIGRCASEERARRWVRVTASILADWGGPAAKDVLSAVLPKQALRGGGTSGRSVEAARKAAAPGTDDGTLMLREAARRSHEPDPGKVSMTLLPILGLIKARMDAGQVATLVASLPEGVARDVRAATAESPWPFAVIDQSYARP